jgi:hypothetical protein
MDHFDSWGTRSAGLFTFAENAKHIALYQKFAFYARFLDRDHVEEGDAERRRLVSFQRLEHIAARRRVEKLPLTESIYDGLDLTHEIRTTSTQNVARRC